MSARGWATLLTPDTPQQRQAAGKFHLSFDTCIHVLLIYQDTSLPLNSRPLSIEVRHWYKAPVLSSVPSSCQFSSDYRIPKSGFHRSQSPSPTTHALTSNLLKCPPVSGPNISPEKHQVSRAAHAQWTRGFFSALDDLHLDFVPQKRVPFPAFIPRHFAGSVIKVQWLSLQDTIGARRSGLCC